jgi:hypothetical protein
MNIYDLVNAIQHTERLQCASYKGELRNKVMEAAHLYADACATSPFSSQAVSDRETDLDVTLNLVFSLILEDK